MPIERTGLEMSLAHMLGNRRGAKTLFAPMTWEVTPVWSHCSAVDSNKLHTEWRETLVGFLFLWRNLNP